MHEEKTVLLKNDMYEFENIKQDEFKTNMYKKSGFARCAFCFANMHESMKLNLVA